MQYGIWRNDQEILIEEGTYDAIQTKFTILIYSEKGNKQAGEINFDVSQFLNAKQKELKVDQLL